MALVLRAYRRHEIPHEAGEWMDVRIRLAPAEIDEAAERYETAQIRRAARLGREAIDFCRESAAASNGTTESKETRNLDMAWLRAYCVREWSYDEEPTEDTMRMLDATTTTWLDELVLAAVEGPREKERVGNS